MSHRIPCPVKMNKRIPFFAFLLGLASFQTAGARSTGPTLTPIVVPPEIQAEIPAGCKIAKIQEGDLRGLDPHDLLIFYQPGKNYPAMFLGKVI
jgi:hypothetical protein